MNCKHRKGSAGVGLVLWSNRDIVLRLIFGLLIVFHVRLYTSQGPDRPPDGSGRDFCLSAINESEPGDCPNLITIVNNVFRC